MIGGILWDVQKCFSSSRVIRKPLKRGAIYISVTNKCDLLRIRNVYIVIGAFFLMYEQAKRIKSLEIL